MSTIDTSTVPDYPGLLRLDGKSTIVVGAGQGMGRQIAHALASAGARVLCVDLDATLAEKVADEVGGTACVANVLDVDEVQRIFDETEKAYGTVDILIDIVGMGLFKTFVDTTEEDWDRMFAINFRHVRLLMQGAAVRMKQNGGGVMVLIGSIDTVSSAPGHAAYAAAKSALLSLVRSAAMELAESNIRINAVSPGLTRTPRLAEMIDSRDGAAVEPLGRVGEPSDIAGAALFLAGGLADHITGQTILVDGGASVMYAYTPR